MFKCLTLLSLVIILFLPGLANTQTASPPTSYAAEDYKDYKKSPHTSPEWDSFVQEGFQMLDRQDTENTIEFLRKAVGLGCQSPLVYFKLALSYEALGSHYSAVQYYEQAKAQFSKANTDHRYNRTFDENYGRALYMMGQTEKALSHLEKAAKSSESFWLLKLLGDLALSKDDTLTATAYYERALRSNDPDLTAEARLDLVLTLARMYAKQDQKDGAKRYYQKVLEIDPNNQEAQKYLASFKQQDSGTYDKIFEILEKH
ncbi:MAG: tetratricopeptide repeat protein [Deltaproteobacteria bacterium]|nr:tetratricopeptide repeat protein [Deltaproteobacteria bacterium]